MDGDQLQRRWRGVAAWLDASPSELVGLVVLVVGAVTVAGMLWWSGRPSPVAQAPGPTSSGPPDDAETGIAPLVGDGSVTLHVAGAVGRPGLVEVPAGSRVADAVAAAGGLLLDADPGALNLAREVVDGERLDVPRIGQAPASGGPGAGGATAGGQDDDVVHLNRATAEELEALPGVGPVLASRIIQYRQANGRFTEVGQLREVAGIGEKTFQALADLVAP